MSEEENLFPSPCNPHVCLPRLPWTVHCAAHHCHYEALPNVGGLPLHFLSNRLHVDLASTTGRTGNHRHAAVPQAERLEDLTPDAHFLFNRTGQRHTDGVTDALSQKYSEADGRTN